MQIDLKGVSKSFGKVEALSGVSLAIPSGLKVAVIGPNGSGKSTLTRIVMGMLSYQGEVLLDGRAPFENRVELARSLAYVPQNSPQLRATVRDVTRAVCQLRGIDSGELETLAARLDLQIDALASRPLRALSGGTRQKLMIALALVARASLVIMDEPTASLDRGARAALFGIYREFAGNATLILCSHRLGEIQHLVDHVIALEDGKVVFDGHVSRFLKARAFSVVELYTADPKQAEWLESHGFSPGAPGAWARTVCRGDKLKLLSEIVAHFDSGHLENLVIRDLETVETAS